MAQIDREVEKSGGSRAQWLSSAIGAYLRLLELAKGADPSEMIRELAQLRTSNESLWKENQQLKRVEERAREEVAQTKCTQGALEEQIASTLAELEKARSDTILLHHDQAHFQDTIKQKDEMIGILQAHCKAHPKASANWPYHQARKRQRKKAVDDSGNEKMLFFNTDAPV